MVRLQTMYQTCFENSENDTVFKECYPTCEMYVSQFIGAQYESADEKGIHRRYIFYNCGLITSSAVNAAKMAGGHLTPTFLFAQNLCFQLPSAHQGFKEYMDDYRKTCHRTVNAAKMAGVNLPHPFFFAQRLR